MSVLTDSAQPFDPATPAPEQVLESAIRPLQVLLVEDNVDDAELIAYELTRGALHVACVRVDTADDLTAALQKHHWDVVLTDYSMPKLTAAVAFALIREHSCAPCVLVSGTASQETARAAMWLGLDDFVTKQNLSALSEVVVRVLADTDRRLAWRASPRVRLQGGQEFRVLEWTVKQAILEGSGLKPGQSKDALLLSDGDVAPVHLQVVSCEVQMLSGSELLYQSIVTMRSDDLPSPR
jgi:CheY-like chemotaxis protein